MKRIIAIALLVFVPLTFMGCTTTNPYTGERQVSKTSIGAGVGAAGGAIIGALAGGGQGAAIGAAAGAVVGGVTGNIMDRQDSELRQRLQGTGVQVMKLPNGDLRLIMPSDITFAFNSADIKSQFYPVLNSVAIVLRKFKDTIVRIDGYTDSTGSAEYNQRLSERRATAVAQYLGAQGVNPNRFAVRGFGERHPIASNANAQGRSMNRRVEITIHPI